MIFSHNLHECEFVTLISFEAYLHVLFSREATTGPMVTGDTSLESHETLLYEERDRILLASLVVE